MTLEGILWQKFRKAWAPDWCQRIDARHVKGVPDVNWVITVPVFLDKYQSVLYSYGGWTELKVVKTRADGALVWRHHRLTLEQALWLNGYAKAGGRCCVVAGETIVGNGWRYYVLRGNYRYIVDDIIPDSMIVVATDMMNETFKRAVAAL